MEVAFPQLRQRRRESGHLPEETLNSAVFRSDTTCMEDTARVRVRRIVAALNGIDVEKETAAWTEPPVLVSHGLVARLTAAFCNEAVMKALTATVGEAEAGALLGEVMTL
jgi:hypothetical protein